MLSFILVLALVCGLLALAFLVLVSNWHTCPNCGDTATDHRIVPATGYLICAKCGHRWNHRLVCAPVRKDTQGE